ncbi:DnaD domain protein [Ligilactobacillus sp. LYQ139]|uniref:DnaD domain protein n=1 Tax=Ligilactobacillus sp. LYQ139 TaxID=3378800 RepID=UPI003853FFCF
MINKKCDVTAGTPYRVQIPARLQPDDLAIVGDLYLPLIGALANALYHQLAGTQKESSRRHSVLLIALGNVAPQDLFAARCRLEALGLLRTFQMTEHETRILSYRVLRPVTPAQFFADDLLSGLLLSWIGADEFNRLLEKWVPNPPLPAGTETTAQLTEVFDMPASERLHAPREAGDENQLHTLGAAIDYQQLDQLLARSYVDRQQVAQNKQRIDALVTLYGLDELQVKELLEQATNLETNRVNFEQVKALAAEQYAGPRPASPVAPATTIKATADHQLSATDQQLVQAAQMYAPMEFLATLKEQNHSFIARSERQTLERVVKYQKLPPAVVNILIHYIMVDQGNDMLPAPLFEAIAADWASKRIDAPAKAIWQARHFNQQKQAKKQSSKRRSRRLVQKENLPAWARSDNAHPSQQAPKKKDKAALDKQRRELLNQLRS